MKHRVTLTLIAGLAVASNAAVAQDLKPIENYSVHLGGVTGSVYYDATAAGPRLVATLSGGPEATPVRFVADLAAGQSATISVPRGPGEPALDVTFTRQGDHVVIADAETRVSSLR